MVKELRLIGRRGPALALALSIGLAAVFVAEKRGVIKVFDAINNFLKAIPPVNHGPQLECYHQLPEEHQILDRQLWRSIVNSSLFLIRTSPSTKQVSTSEPRTE